jgi:hypothetical protein
MSKQDYTMYTYKADKRKKTGERLLCVRVYALMREEEMVVIASALADINPGHRFEYFSTMVTVKNLMTGKEVQIPADTPWCCNPASETYWSS